MGWHRRSQRKIRTYNPSRNRLTDHGISLTSHQLAMVIEGMFQPTLDPLLARDIAERLRAEIAE